MAPKEPERYLSTADTGGGLMRSHRDAQFVLIDEMETFGNLVVGWREKPADAFRFRKHTDLDCLEWCEKRGVTLHEQGTDPEGMDYTMSFPDNKTRSSSRCG